MNKKLNELTLEDWGELFPVRMYDYNSDWLRLFELEKESIEEVLTKDIALRIEHIGSTSIPNLKSKDSIDLLIEIPEKYLFDENIISKMSALGFHFFRQPGFGMDYMIFVKGFHTDGKKSQKFFAHMTIKDHSQLWERIYFRDYLRNHPKDCERYENLKCDLAQKHSKNKIEYRIGKTDFVKEITDRAKKSALVNG